MEHHLSTQSSPKAAAAADSTWFLFTLLSSSFSSTVDPTTFLFLLLLSFLSLSLLTWALSPAGPAWSHSSTRLGPTPIPGPRGLPFLGSLLSLTPSPSSDLPHRTLHRLSKLYGAHHLLAFSIGSTPAVVATHPTIAKDILTHPNFADRPLKSSARDLMFGRAIGFAPNGTYWRLLRRIAASHLFSPRRVAAHEPGRQLDSDLMLRSVSIDMARSGSVRLRPHLQAAALNNIMGSVFGKRYDVSRDTEEVEELRAMVREGFELLGSFNWSDHLPWLAHFYDPSNVKARCADLVPRVRRFVSAIIEEHRIAKNDQGVGGLQLKDNADFVDVLLSLKGEEKLAEDDMIAVLWEMIFRGADTTALLTEWAMAELVLNPRVQNKLLLQINAAVGVNGKITDADVSRMPYLQAVIKETLRSHPPGPLLSWARLSTDDVHLSNGMVVPAGTTAMVNMWGITHDESVWARPDVFDPERFVEADVDLRGSDLRLAPFGAGRRVCPGKNLGLVTVGLWIAKLVQLFEWGPVNGVGVDLVELLKLSLEMKNPLNAVAVLRENENACIINQ